MADRCPKDPEVAGESLCGFAALSAERGSVRGEADKGTFVEYYPNVNLNRTFLILFFLPFGTFFLDGVQASHNEVHLQPSHR